MSRIFTFSLNSAELHRSCAKLTNANDQLDVAKRENAKLSATCKDLSACNEEHEKRLHQSDQDKRR